MYLTSNKIVFQGGNVSLILMCGQGHQLSTLLVHHRCYMDCVLSMGTL